MSQELKPTIQQAAAQRRALIEFVPGAASGLDWCSGHSELVDSVIQEVSRATLETYPGLTPLSVVATGGYGRKELAPYSDIDLTVIPLDESDPNLDGAIRQLYLGLQEAASALGMEMGYAFRLITDVPGLDAKTRTGLLDGRLVYGSHIPFEMLSKLFWETFPVGEFIIAKIEERNLAFSRTNDTPLTVQPHLKEGAGGIRCFHSANWIGAAIGERSARPTLSFDRVLRMRNALHFTAGRKVDLLTRPRQSQVADVLCQPIFPMLSELAEDLLSLHELYLKALESLQDARFPLSDAVLSIRGEARVAGGATASSAAAGIAVATKLGIRVADLPSGTTKLGDGPQAMEALSGGEGTIRNLDRCGVLQALLPELTRCRTLMPNDSMHEYTVYEHTLRVVRNLDEIAANHDYLGEIRDSISNLGPLYLAALLHDVGKFDASKPHSESGRLIAADVCLRLGLEPATTEVVCWLVEHHLLMSHTVQMRDIQLPETIRDFVKAVGSSDRLAMLTLLTWADISAVGQNTLTAVQESLLKELYLTTQTALTEGQHLEADDPSTRKRVMKRLADGAVPDEDVHAFVQSLPAHYLLGTPPERIREHLKVVRETTSGEPFVGSAPIHESGVTEFTVCCRDTPGLLSRILAVFYAFDLSLVGLRASTTETEPRIALDVFTTTFGERVVPPATVIQVQKALSLVVKDLRHPDDFLSQRGKDPDRQQQIFQYTFLEGNPGILEIRAPRGRGMAYRISRLIAAQGWNTLAARVGQWAGRGAAAFYITGKQGAALTKSEVDAVLAVQV